MKKKIILSRIFHRGKWRILISFQYDQELTSVIRNIKGSCYTETYKGWYVIDNEEVLKTILHLLEEKAEVDSSSLVQKTKAEERPEIIKAETSFQKQSKIQDVVKKNSFGTDDEHPDIKKEIKNQSKSKLSPVEFRINEQDGRLVVRFMGVYDHEWIDEIASYGQYHYDKVNKEFLLPWSVLIGDSLSDYFSSRGVEVKIVKSSPSKVLRISRKEKGDEIRNRPLSSKAFAGLELMGKYLEEVRYSTRTIESYLAVLELFFKYFNEKDPVTISMKEISEFVYEFIVNNGYSSAYQNQMISAIKTFYRISGRRKFELDLIERPRRSRALPKVLSKDEVKRILSSTRNVKHKLLLWIIYSCGLRRSEVTNIQLNDLDRDRSVLHIKEGKGRIDRIVPVSPKVWDKLDEYIEGFKPVKYLFEGQSGGRYSVESVYNVFKQALHKAGIKKEVGVHSLRHSYATHLHETGLDIRYIQELLGHKSTRTTEIYTHVSRRNLIQVRSPIEDLDIK